MSCCVQPERAAALEARHQVEAATRELRSPACGRQERQAPSQLLPRSTSSTPVRRRATALARWPDALTAALNSPAVGGVFEHIDSSRVACRWPDRLDGRVVPAEDRADACHGDVRRAIRASWPDSSGTWAYCQRPSISTPSSSRPPRIAARIHAGEGVIARVSSYGARSGALRCKIGTGGWPPSYPFPWHSSRHTTCGRRT